MPSNIPPTSSLTSPNSLRAPKSTPRPRQQAKPAAAAAMKFGKRLKRQIDETLPEWRDKFISYKNLKRLVRRISAAQPSSSTEAEFIYLLNAEIDKLNAFFVEQEEEFVIHQREFRERIQRVTSSRPPDVEYEAEMARIRKEMVNFHGEMVLLMNYSSINYTGLGKILKKYDKRTGAVLRLPFVEKILKQPFFTTDLISKLVKECETTMEAVFPAAAREQQPLVFTAGLISKLVKDCENTMEVVFPAHAPEQPELRGGGGSEEEEEEEEEEALVVAEQSIFKNTVVALMTMQELRKGSSTYGQFSLPPLNLTDAEALQLSSPITIL